MRINYFYRRSVSSQLIINSAWGVTANILQTVFISLFFLILVRSYSPIEFAQFVLATTIYQILVAISSMNLGPWFIRAYAEAEDKIKLTAKFFKIQLCLGVLFYLVNLVLAFVLFQDSQTRLICIIFGVNIVFDNLVYGISRLNVAEFRQKKTAKVMVVDGILKLVVSLILLVYPFSIIYLSFFLIVIRLVTLNLLIIVGSASAINAQMLWYTEILFNDIKTFIFSNWKFVVIGGTYIINWRIGNIFISRFLSLDSVAQYEVAFKVYNIAFMVPAMITASVYPRFIEYYKKGDFKGLKQLYKLVFFICTIYTIASYAFIYSFGDFFIQQLFGKSYIISSSSIRLMFVTLFFTTTASLQASLLIAMGLEKMDLIFNLVNLFINISGCLVGLHVYKTIDVVNYSILSSVVCFHILQSVLLIKKGITSTRRNIRFYVGICIFIYVYQILIQKFDVYLPFLIVIGLLLAYTVLRISHLSGLNLTEAIIAYKAARKEKAKVLNQ